jgi:endonuclease YncB( thermonuclease family)
MNYRSKMRVKRQPKPRIPRWVYVLIVCAILSSTQNFWSPLIDGLSGSASHRTISVLDDPRTAISSHPNNAAVRATEVRGVHAFSSDASSVAAGTLKGRVIGVSDGDTITVRTPQGNIKVRLAQIDAPEATQPWGNRSRQELSGMVAGKEVGLNIVDEDQYGRSVAQIDVNGLDVNRAMVERGAAWAYRRYVTDPSMVDAEQSARSRARGLWAMPANQRIAPWEYRRDRRSRDIMSAAR